MKSSKSKYCFFNMKQRKRFFYRDFKWFAWFSLLSLYFLISYILTSLTITTKATLYTSKPSSLSRALIETNIKNIHRPINRNMFTFPDSLNDVQVYVYDLPKEYNSVWLSNERCSNHLFAAEVAIHKALMDSKFRTLNPFEADFYFVPVYVACNFSTLNGFPSLSHAHQLFESAVHLISSSMPFWNRTGGSDHVFVASHDYGACFHAMEEDAIASGIPEFLKNSIILQTFGVKHYHPCQDVEHILIPAYVSPGRVRSTLQLTLANVERDIWVYFRGKMEVHPKNISGKFYSRKVRTEIWRRYNRDRRFHLYRKRFSGYQSEIVRSVFCLCPRGWAPWSPRLVESVIFGCVPVIIADGIELPSSDLVRWPEISLTVAEKDIGNLAEILEHVATTNLTVIQKNLWNPANREALLFNAYLQSGDATWNVVRELSNKLHRSIRRSNG